MLGAACHCGNLIGATSWQKVHCSPRCKKIAEDRKQNARRARAVRLLTYMEDNCPNALAKIWADMGPVLSPDNER